MSDSQAPKLTVEEPKRPRGRPRKVQMPPQAVEVPANVVMTTPAPAPPAPAPAKKAPPKSMVGKHEAKCPVCEKEMRADNILGSHFKKHLQEIPNFMSARDRVFEYDRKSCLVYAVDAKIKDASRYLLCYCLVCNKGKTNENGRFNASNFHRLHSHHPKDRLEAFEKVKDLYRVDDATRVEATREPAPDVKPEEPTLTALKPETLAELDKVVEWEEDEKTMPVDDKLMAVFKALNKIHAIEEKRKKDMDEKTQLVEKLQEELEEYKEYVEKLETELKKYIKPKEEKTASAKKKDKEGEALIDYLSMRVDRVEGEGDDIEPYEFGREYYNDDIDIETYLESHDNDDLKHLFQLYKDFIDGDIEPEEYIEGTRAILERR